LGCQRILAKPVVKRPGNWQQISTSVRKPSQSFVRDSVAVNLRSATGASPCLLKDDMVHFPSRTWQYLYLKLSNERPRNRRIGPIRINEKSTGLDSEPLPPSSTVQRDAVRRSDELQCRSKR
jgi:hypothetical protein